MFKKIVWATDGSESADRAMELAKSLASADGATLPAVHSVEYIAAKGVATQFPDEDDRQARIERQVAELVGKV